jgi:hypothetical protein
MISPTTLRAMRLTHHYIGIFIAPAILFFAVTGFIQTFSLHETTRGSSYVPPAILVHLSQLHKKATLTVPTRKPDTAPKPSPAPPAAPKPPQAPQPAQSYHWPMKLFFAVVAIGLATSTLTGLVMAWKYNRSKATVSAIFLAGIVLPVLFLFF